MTAGTPKTLDPNLTMVILGVIGIIVPLATLAVNFVQNASIATDQSARASIAAAEVREVAVKVEDARRDLVANTSAAAVAVRDVATKVEEARQHSVSEAAAVAEKVEETRVNVAANTAAVDQKLDVIHNTIVNGPLTKALQTIEKMKKILQTLAPNDVRVKELLAQ